MSLALPGYNEAAALVAGFAETLASRQHRVERVSLALAGGRVLAEPLRADQDQPAFPRSTRDGFAGRAEELSRHEFLALHGSTRAGEASSGSLPQAAVWEIMTGAPVPEGADAVAMIEHVAVDADRVRLLPPRVLNVGENIVAKGAQAHAGDEVLPVGTRIGAGQIALAATCGCAELAVFARPRVAILTTGDELVSVDSVPGPSQIRNSNGPMLAAMVAAAGGEPWLLPNVADTASALDAALDDAKNADLMILSGGVSAGKFDLVEPALARIGARFHFTGVRIQPGKPLVFGSLPRGATHNAFDPHQSDILPFFGLPGNPVSSAVTFLLFAAPVLSALTGAVEGPRFALARLCAASDKKGRAGLTRFLPSFCSFRGTADHVPSVARVPWQGSGDLAAMARSNCFLVVPEEVDQLQAGEIVRILLA